MQRRSRKSCDRRCTQSRSVKQHAVAGGGGAACAWGAAHGGRWRLRGLHAGSSPRRPADAVRPVRREGPGPRRVTEVAQPPRAEQPAVGGGGGAVCARRPAEVARPARGEQSELAKLSDRAELVGHSLQIHLILLSCIERSSTPALPLAGLLFLGSRSIILVSTVH